MSIQGIEGWRKAFGPWFSIPRACLAAGGLCAVAGGVCLAYGKGGEQARPPIVWVEGGKKEVMIQAQDGATALGGSAPQAVVSGAFVASKSGKRYYPAGCSAANRISPANLVSFGSEEEAKGAGLTRAATCQF